ncbi:MAG TPA: ComF family protein [Thermoanaerobaculia bacterium]|nr:ComF family protein [Thermoanaerobaculia bacterium]
MQSRPESRFGRALSIVGRQTLRIVLPSWCIVCEAELPWRDRTASCCANCWASLPRIETGRCNSCAIPLAAGASLCIECIADPLPVDWCEAWGQYRDGLARLLQALKFERHDFLDDALAGLLDERMRDRGFDAIAAVPMPRKKERRRGYNQAELLARALSRRTGIACDMTLLERRGDRAPQSTLARRAERAKNARGAFAATDAANGKSVLVVDDICTTGATLRACAEALREAGAARVCTIAVARAL